MPRFFVSCPLGFEQVLAQEFKEFWFEMIDLDGAPTRQELPELEILKGGIEFECVDHLALQCNFFSKIASRVLLRFNRFEARYYDQFEKNLAKLELEKILDFSYLQNQISVKIETHKSRLNNEKNLLEAAQNALKNKNIKITEEAKQSVFIRIEKDRVTISLDTSGEHLHRRGYAQHRGEAPMRETLAAYMVRLLHKYNDLNKELNLVDPFVGSGTLLFEALSNNLPNLNRDYSWLHFKNAPKLFKSESWKKNYRWFAQNSQIKAQGFDIDSKTIKAANSNLETFKKLFFIENLNLEFLNQDSQKLKIQNHNTWIITNPPYGVRLAGDQALKILENFDTQVQGLIVVHPEKWKFNFKNLKLKEQQDFSNQGIDLKLSVFQI